jgi:hypothetical protein
MNNFTAMVRETINSAIPYIRSKNPTFPHCISHFLKYPEDKGTKILS